MSYCAKCLIEIAPRVKDCPQCGSPVVGQLAPEQKVRVEWCLVGIFNDVTQANMAKIALESNGLPVLLKTDVIHSALLVQGTALPGAYALLFVLRRDRLIARRIVKGMTGK